MPHLRRPGVRPSSSLRRQGGTCKLINCLNRKRELWKSEQGYRVCWTYQPSKRIAGARSSTVAWQTRPTLGSASNCFTARSRKTIRTPEKRGNVALVKFCAVGCIVIHDREKPGVCEVKMATSHRPSSASGRPLATGSCKQALCCPLCSDTYGSACMQFCWIRCALKNGQRGYLYGSLLTHKGKREEFIRVLTNCGTVSKVCSLMCVSSGWPTYSFIVT